MPRKKSSPAASFLEYIATGEVNAVAVVLELANATYAARTDRAVSATVAPKKRKKRMGTSASEIPEQLPPQGRVK